MALREVLAHFGVEVETDKLERADSAIDGLIDKARKLGEVLVGGEVAKGVFEFGKRIAEQGEAIEQASIRVGVSTDALQQYGFAATQTGSDVGSLTFALLMLEDKIGDAMINASGEGAKAFAKYHIAIRDAKGSLKDTGSLFEEVADKIADTKDPAKQVTIAMDLFGRQGRALLPLLKQGKDGIAELKEEFAALGGGMSKEAIDASKKYVEQMHRLDAANQGLTGQIGVILLPVLGRLVDWVTKGSVAMRDLVDHTSLVQTVLGGLGAVLTVFAVKSAIAFAPWLVWAAALAGVILIIEDIVTMFRGGDSLMGRFLDQIGGKDFHVEVVKEIKDEWANLRDVFKELGPFAHEFVEELRWIYNFGKDVAQILGKIGGYIGDEAGKAHNFLVNHGVASGAPRTSGGNDYDTNAAIQQAGLMNNAFARGDSSFSPTEVPAYYAQRGAAGKDEWLDLIKQWADFMRAQKQQVMTTTPLGMAPGMGVFTQKNEIHVHDASDPQKTAKVVHDVIKQRHAAAAEALHKKASAQ